MLATMVLDGSLIWMMMEELHATILLNGQNTASILNLSIFHIQSNQIRLN